MPSMRKIILKLLKVISKIILSKYRPQIVAITGSFGKTTAKEAIYATLKDVSGKRIRKNQGNLNSQWGLPLTVIGSPDPRGSNFKYVLAILKGVGLIMSRRRNYPELLVLEMGADKPGDIAYLVDIAKPDLAVLTGIGETHLEFFGSVEQVSLEKQRLLKALSAQGTAIVNKDDQIALSLTKNLECRILTYGLGEGADLQASRLSPEVYDLEHEQLAAPGQVGGTSFEVVTEGAVGTAYMPDMIGKTAVYAGLAGLAVCKALGLDLKQGIVSLRQNLEPAPGRMRLLRGIKQTTLLDDSYNSSPQAVILALETLAELPKENNSWAVLGDMLELGVQTEALHEQVGRRFVELTIDNLITVGVLAHHMADAARTADHDPDQVFEFEEPEEAGRFLQSRLHEGDLVLIKGSHGVHLEKIVKEVMAEPERAEDLIVQS